MRGGPDMDIGTAAECGAVEVGGGVRLVPPTEGLLAEVELNLRPGDRMEHDFVGGSLRALEGMPTWVVMDGGDAMGAGGFVLPAGATHLSSVRVAWFLSTNAVETRRVRFVRMTRRVLAAMCRGLPPWVDTIVATPMADYPQAVRWLVRVVGMRPAGKTYVDGAEFRLLAAPRKELEDV